MVSPNSCAVILFRHADDEQLKAIAMIARNRPMGRVLCWSRKYTRQHADAPAGRRCDLIYSGGGEGAICNALVGSIAKGEILGFPP